jgi:hypothetical protein
VSGDSAYGTGENITTIEKMGIRAYVALKGAGQGRPFLGKDEFSIDPERDLYTCPAGELFSAHAQLGKESDRLPGEVWHLRRLLVERRLHGQQAGAAILAPFR